MSLKKMHFSIMFITLALPAMLFANEAENTIAQANLVDTIYVQEHITDTVYLPALRDTVFIDTSNGGNVVLEVNSDFFKNKEKLPEREETEEEFQRRITRDFVYPEDIPPTFTSWLNPAIAADIILIALKALFIDYTFEKENWKNGSILVNYAAVMMFGDAGFMSDPQWNGFKSTMALPMGYRYYLNISQKPVDITKAKARHRYTPHGNTSLFVEGFLGPSLSIENVNYIEEDKSYSKFDVGFVGSIGVGIAMNFHNFLFTIGADLGYQYWGDKVNNQAILWDDSDSIGYSLAFGTTSKGFFVKPQFLIGF